MYYIYTRRRLCTKSLVLPRKNAPLYLRYTVGRLRTQFVICGERSSSLHCRSQTETNNLYDLIPKWNAQVPRLIIAPTHFLVTFPSLFKFTSRGIIRDLREHNNIKLLSSLKIWYCSRQVPRIRDTITHAALKT